MTCRHYWVLDSIPVSGRFHKVCRDCGEEGYDPSETKITPYYPKRKNELVTQFLSSKLPKYMSSV